MLCYGVMVLWCYGVMVLRRYDVDALIRCVLNGSPPMGTPRRAEATRRRRGCGTTLRLKISELLNRLPPIHQRIARAGYASYPLYPATTVTPPPTMRLKISELLNRLPPIHQRIARAGYPTTHTRKICLTQSAAPAILCYPHLTRIST